MQNGTANLEDGWEVIYKIKHMLTIPAITVLGIDPKPCVPTRICVWMFLAAFIHNYQNLEVRCPLSVE